MKLKHSLKAKSDFSFNCIKSNMDGKLLHLTTTEEEEEEEEEYIYYKNMTQ